MTREEAIDVFKHNYPSACFTDLCEAVEIAIQALSAQPERKKGKWIPKSESGCIIECSSCGERMTVLGDENPNFCPYCGSYNGDESDDIPIEYFENGGI